MTGVPVHSIFKALLTRMMPAGARHHADWTERVLLMIFKWNEWLASWIQKREGSLPSRSNSCKPQDYTGERECFFQFRGLKPGNRMHPLAITICFIAWRYDSNSRFCRLAGCNWRKTRGARGVLQRKSAAHLDKHTKAQQNFAERPFRLPPEPSARSDCRTDILRPSW